MITAPRPITAPQPINELQREDAVAEPQRPTPPHEPSTGELISRVSQQMSTLVRDEIRLAKAVKFIEHDLVLYLRELPYQADEYIIECRRLFRDYLPTGGMCALPNRGDPQCSNADDNSE